MQPVHAHGVRRRLEARGAARRLQHPELRLELERVPAERVEGAADGLLVVAAARPARQVLQPRQGRQRRAAGATGFLSRHLV